MKKNRKKIKKSCLDNTEFLKFCTLSKKIKIPNSNLVISEIMIKTNATNKNVIGHLVWKYYNQSKQDIVSDVLKNSLRFNDKEKITLNKYEFIVENINGVDVIFFCEYLSINNSIVFLAALPYEVYKAVYTLLCISS